MAPIRNPPIRNPRNPWRLAREKPNIELAEGPHAVDSPNMAVIWGGGGTRLLPPREGCCARG
eukprot:15464489-Alexandrium_andersonii.AAC.1